MSLTGNYNCRSSNMLIDEKIPVIPYFSPLLPWISDYKNIFQDLRKAESLEFECLNFNLKNINEIIEKIAEIDPTFADKYIKMLNDKAFYTYIFNEIKRDITKEAINVKKNFNVQVHTHSFGDYFKNRYS